MARPARSSRDRRLAHHGMLDDPARRFLDLEREWGELESAYPPRGPVRYLIRTGFFDSHVDRAYGRGVRPRGLVASPDVRARATFRSVWDPARQLRSVLVDERLKDRSLACARREIRKEVLFALGRTGRGARARRRERRGDSKYRC